MEYAKVLCTGTIGDPVARGVLIDGQSSGQTNQTLMVGEGHHIFTLEGEANYTPSQAEVNVQHSSSTDPIIVNFSVAAA